MAARVESLDARRRARQTEEEATPRSRAVALRPVAPLPPVPRKRESPLRGLVREIGNELWNQFTPELLAEINDEVAARLKRVPTQPNEYGYDPWGLQFDAFRRALVATTLLYRMRDQGAKYGMATMCVGQGQGVATIFEACNGG